MTKKDFFQKVVVGKKLVCNLLKYSLVFNDYTNKVLVKLVIEFTICFDKLKAVLKK